MTDKISNKSRQANKATATSTTNQTNCIKNSMALERIRRPPFTPFYPLALPSLCWQTDTWVANGRVRKGVRMGLVLGKWAISVASVWPNVH